MTGVSTATRLQYAKSIADIKNKQKDLAPAIDSASGTLAKENLAAAKFVVGADKSIDGAKLIEKIITFNKDEFNVANLKQLNSYQVGEINGV